MLGGMRLWVGRFRARREQGSIFSSRVPSQRLHETVPTPNIIDCITWLHSFRGQLRCTLQTSGCRPAPGWSSTLRDHMLTACDRILTTVCWKLYNVGLITNQSRRWRSNPSRKCSKERMTRGTVTSTLRGAAYPSRCARSSAGAGWWSRTRLAVRFDLRIQSLGFSYLPARGIERERERERGLAGGSERKRTSERARERMPCEAPLQRTRTRLEVRFDLRIQGLDFRV